MYHLCALFFSFFPDLYKLDGPMPSDSPEYVGCFADDPEDRALANAIKFQDNMTQAVCRVYCESFDSRFYATQVREYILSTSTNTEGCF